MFSDGSNRMFRRDEYQILNKMLDDAISGDFHESRFDESELSKLQSKLMRYLSSASMSERKLQEEKNRIEELITNISHQTKTPLTSIMIYSQLRRDSSCLRSPGLCPYPAPGSVHGKNHPPPIDAGSGGT